MALDKLCHKPEHGQTMTFSEYPQVRGDAHLCYAVKEPHVAHMITQNHSHRQKTQGHSGRQKVEKRDAVGTDVRLKSLPM